MIGGANDTFVLVYNGQNYEWAATRPTSDMASFFTPRVRKEWDRLSMEQFGKKYINLNRDQKVIIKAACQE